MWSAKQIAIEPADRITSYSDFWLVLQGSTWQILGLDIAFDSTSGDLLGRGQPELRT